MNFVAPILTAIAYPTANTNTESARRDNVQRETIPKAGDAEQGASQKGLGSEADKAKSPGLPQPPVTYDRPQIQTDLQAAFQNVFGQEKDNAQDESAGKESAEQEQRNQQQSAQPSLTEEDKQKIEDLKARDQEVRTHEQAHAATGGQYAGSPQYEYTTGPDNKRYVTGGEVSIDISEEQSAEQTLRKMQQVRAAALAPAQPSSQDLKVAAEAAQKAFDARNDIAKENRDSLQSSGDVSAAEGVNSVTGVSANGAVSESEPSGQGPSDQGIGAQGPSAQGISALNPSEITIPAVDVAPPSIDEITDSAGVDTPTRRLDETTVTSQAQASEVKSLEAEESSAMQARIGRIQNLYTQAYTPSREGLSLQA
ncbi:putative metalloprotease CJM1_0395 family protein [Alteromonas sp. BMJM2]|uniref:putative metalloprotease CJM1_0395 family protein n=1 Tax=Alteromonas sp. BMJM2 TaxID=2954241 RepID=UPI0022B51A97|nr:putative metalloprotease CJM1_0395 family protein [Alteromonas sp. BMJM2]